MGAAPAPLVVLPIGSITMIGPPATGSDYTPMLNVMTFGMCMSPSNPTVAAATAAALGVLTPMPCIPMTVTPWNPPLAAVTAGTGPAVSATCMLMCTWGGMISQVFPGQVPVMLPM